MKKSSFFVIFFLWIFTLPLYASPTKLTRILIIHEDMTKIIFKRNQASKVQVFTLSKPDRIIFDFKNTTLSMGMNDIGLEDASHIKKIRHGAHKDFLRIVFDLDQPVLFKKMENETSLTVDILPLETKAKPKESSKTIEKIVKIAPTEKSKKIFKIVIDPGHGGKDPGAIGDLGTKEKDVVLGIAKKLANLINQNPNMRAILTREGDYYVPLKDRLVFARKDKADLFVAIHADSYFNTRAKGASVYSLSPHGASTAAAKWLAEKENHSELDGLDLGNLEDQSIQLRSVLIDMAQTQTIKDSLRYGASILDHLLQVTRLHYATVEGAPFLVLKSPDIPSLLVEIGFISNIDEEKRLRDQNHQQKIAKALYRGIRSGRQVMTSSL